MDTHAEYKQLELPLGPIGPNGPGPHPSGEQKIGPEYVKNMRIKGSKKVIWVTFQKEGIHCYPAAASDPKLKTGGDNDVSFLGFPHRHMFHFKVELLVGHNDRDVEFIQLKRELESLYNTGIMELNHKSCEMIADDLAKYIIDKYPNRPLTITVSEDGENGCTANYW